MPPQTGLKEKYFYTKNITTFFIRGVEVLHLETGLGREFFFEALRRLRRKVVTEKRLVNRFSICWTFFRRHRPKKHNGGLYFGDGLTPGSLREKVLFFYLECAQAETGFWIRCTTPEYPFVRGLVIDN